MIVTGSLFIVIKKHFLSGNNAQVPLLSVCLWISWINESRRVLLLRRCKKECRDKERQFINHSINYFCSFSVCFFSVRRVYLQMCVFLYIFVRKYMDLTYFYVYCGVYWANRQWLRLPSFLLKMNFFYVVLVLEMVCLWEANKSCFIDLSHNVVCNKT